MRRLGVRGLMVIVAVMAAFAWVIHAVDQKNRRHKQDLMDHLVFNAEYDARHDDLDPSEFKVSTSWLGPYSAQVDFCPKDEARGMRGRRYVVETCGCCGVKMDVRWSPLP